MPSQLNPRRSNADYARIITLAQQGLNTEQIATELQVAIHQVWRALRTQGIAIPRKPNKNRGQKKFQLIISSEQQALMKTFADSGISGYSIAERLELEPLKLIRELRGRQAMSAERCTAVTQLLANPEEREKLRLLWDRSPGFTVVT
ncbi:hypothetical protein GO988_17365 [Hymenobacter sp. HMF4947]|uniref:Uncharacterized protein n=1 Tax=Hymenobacter ginkgonis TaxID=2682976 RepID=A0A7K1TIU7_9BACT|nr:hypothetical protein [Hymenobacter ginkgonis]MVN78101.1 hypothetical protein [Hymenobacter ginkgonis]